MEAAGTSVNDFKKDAVTDLSSVQQAVKNINDEVGNMPTAFTNAFSGPEGILTKLSGWKS